MAVTKQEVLLFYPRVQALMTPLCVTANTFHAC